MTKTLEPPVGDPEFPIHAYHCAVMETLTATQELAASLRAAPSPALAMPFLDELIASQNTITGREPQWQIAIKRAWAKVRAKLATASQLGTSYVAHRAHATAAGHSYGWGHTHSTSGHMCALDLARIMVGNDRDNTSMRHSGLNVYIDEARLNELLDDIHDEHERALTLWRASPNTILGLSHSPTDPRSAEAEARRIERKWDRLGEAGETPEGLCRLWRETTDMVFRTNLSEDSRAEELLFLRVVASSLATIAQEFGTERRELLKLESRLRRIMPREWFHDHEQRTAVELAVDAANVEVGECLHASRDPTRENKAELPDDLDATGNDCDKVANATSEELPSAEDKAADEEFSNDENGRPASAARSDVGRASAALYRSGNMYVLEFAGASAHLPDLVGLAHIRQLLMHPNKPIHTWTLYTGDPPPGQVYEEQIDGEALRSYEASIAELEQRCEESENVEERMELAEQAAKIRSHHQAVTKAGNGGRKARETASNVENMRMRVGQAIKRALAKLEVECPPLHEHLTKHLIGPSRFMPCYTCPEEELPVWDLMPKPAPPRKRRE